MKFSIDKDKDGRYAVIKLEEKNLNSIVAPDLKSEFVILANEGFNNLIFDLSAVEYIDSSGLSAILTANRLWKTMGSFILTDVSHPAVQKLIDISRLSAVLTILPTVSEAIDLIFMEEIERELNADLDEGIEEEDER
ncbi:MAG: STAS domain-containing protein [Saprospiraceae bacterium]|jgi:anti-anti-sigma factor|nr:STAS domain-containing protein [Saprospiraceae bacterium]